MIKSIMMFMLLIGIIYPLFCGFWKARQDTASTAELSAKIANKKAQQMLNKIK